MSRLYSIFIGRFLTFAYNFCKLLSVNIQESALMNTASFIYMRQNNSYGRMLKRF